MDIRKIKISLLVLISFATHAQNKTFTNPLLPSGADPYSFYKDGYYYYTHTMQDSLVIWKTTNLANLKTAERKTIFAPKKGTMYSKELWAPEIHFIQDKWYVYFAGDDGKNDHHRMYVLQNGSTDPTQGEWEFKGQIGDSSNKWAIDGDVFEYKNQLYMLWAGWQGDVNEAQHIYIAKMKDPLTIEGERVRISSSTYEWEKHGDLNDPDNPPHVDVNEGPQILEHNDKLFIIYSASGCWTEFYALGMLTFNGQENLLDSSAWTKSDHPVFKQSTKNGVFAPGHNSFFKSPSGKEDWILYHANSEPNQGCGWHRSPRAQPFTWNKDGTPNFGEPVKANVPMVIPQ